MKRLLLSLFAILLLPVLAHAQTASLNDYCAALHKQSVPISVSSATTTSLVAPVTGTSIYICGFYISSVGGTSTLEYGTGATCGTGTTTLTGAFAAATTVSLYPATSELLNVPTSNRLCLLSGTSTSATVGMLTYVQK